MQTSQMPTQQMAYSPYNEQQLKQQSPNPNQQQPSMNASPQVHPQDLQQQSMQPQPQTITVNIQQQQMPNMNGGMVPVQMPQMNAPQLQPGQMLQVSTDVWQKTQTIQAYSVSDGYIKVDLGSKVTYLSSTNVGPKQNCSYFLFGCDKKSVEFKIDQPPQGIHNLEGFRVRDMALCCSDKRDIIDESDDSLLGTITFKSCSEESEVTKDGKVMFKINDARAASRSSRWCYEFPCLCVCLIRQFQMVGSQGEKDCLNNNESLVILDDQGNRIFETTPKSHYETFRAHTRTKKVGKSTFHVVSTKFHVDVPQYDNKQKKLFAGILANLTSFSYNQFACN